MTKINLKRTNTSLFELHTDFLMNSETFDQLFGEYSKQFEEPLIIFVNVYSYQKTKHGMFVVLVEVEEGKYHLHIQYRTDPDIPTPPKSMWKPERAFELLKPIAGLCDFDINLFFSYPINRFSSILRLPIQLAPGDTSDFDEIRGVRLVKLTNNKVKFNIVVDHQSEYIRHNLNFAYEGQVTSDTIKDAFNMGVNISEKFIRVLTLYEVAE